MASNGLKCILNTTFKHHFFFFLKCGKCPGPEPLPQMWNFPHFFFFFDGFPNRDIIKAV